MASASPSLFASNQGNMDGRYDYCNLCRMMLSPSGIMALRTLEGFIHYNREDCGRSAEMGCTLCLLLLKHGWWKPDNPTKVRFTGFEPAKFSERQEFGLWPVCLAGLFGRAVNSGQRIHKITVHAFEESPATKFFSCRPIITDFIGDTAYAYARSWLSQCLSSHDDCMRQVSAPLPSRLIDVGLDPDSPWIKLHITDSDAERGSYAALSYCWGGDQHLKTSKSSIEELKSGFAVATLPRTLQDAIEVTRKIGIRTAKDKHMEILNMGSIYKNATITIAATIASSVTEGFLRVERQPPKSYPYDLPMDDGTTEKILLSTEYVPSGAEPLDTRGWAFQERLLSPRLLQFTGTEITWTCQTEPFKAPSGSEAYKPWNSDPQLPPQLFVRHAFTQKSRTSREQQMTLWADIVHAYSHRRLTYVDDRPLALLGIVTELQKIWKDEYIHGLWKDCMIPLLAWFTTCTSIKWNQRSSRAPSWSWQSLDRGISLYSNLEIEDAHFISIDPASMGSQARISLACKMLDEEAIPAEKRFFERYDIDGNEYPDKEVFFLLLGYCRDSGTTALMVVNVENALFRRVGYVETFRTYEELWSTCQKQIIFLE